MELKEKIKFNLKETNPWWKSKSFKVKNYLPREVFIELKKFLKLPQILALVGLRRTGKTTLLLKCIEITLPRINPENILYFCFDDFSALDIEDILIAYREIFPQKNLKSEKFLFCLDEIQKLENWQEKTKKLYDIYPNIKIIISGSESLFLRKGIYETLGGRIFEFKISPLTFKEYLGFIDKSHFLQNTELYNQEIIKEYRMFLKTNGFPELARIRDEMIIHRYLKESIIDRILFKDIPQLFKVRNISPISEILDIINFSPGQIIDISKLAKELGLSRQVVSSYLDYLEKAFLIKKIYNFSRSLRKQKRALKKYYPAVVYPIIVDEKFSSSFENSIIWQLGVEFFYRDAYKNEVDAILTGPGKDLIAVEIKTGKPEFKGIKYFIEKFKVKKALVLTLNYEGKEEKIKILPFYKFMYSSERKRTKTGL